MKHRDYRPQKLKQWEDDWIIFPVSGYGDENIMRQLLDAEKPDAIFLFTDPRFFMWLFNMSDEIRDRNIPIFYNHLWDNYPVPKFNKHLYDSCDFIGCISKLTCKIMESLKYENYDYIPHAVDADIFAQFDEKKILELREKSLGENKDKFVVFYNSRNARRKQTSDVIKTFKMFLDKVGQDKAFLLMHTDPHDKEGANLIEVANMLELKPSQIAFSAQRVPPEQMAVFYNIADVTINISNNEGFGLSALESLSCGTSVIVNETGGLQDQPIDNEGNVFGVMIKPATKSLTGSQEIPYIIDDRCADKDVIAAFEKLYNMTREERSEMGKKAREWTLKAFTMKSMVGKWDKAFTKYIEKFKKEGYTDRIRFVEV